MGDLLRRYGDDPVMVYETWLQKVNRDPSERGKYVATPKFDGWRRFIYWEDGDRLTLLSKARGKGDEARRELPSHLMDQLRALLSQCPRGMAWDTEWLGPRGGFDDCLVLHDFLYSANMWVGHLGYEKRHPLMERMMDAAGAASIAPLITVVPAYRDVDLEELYEAQKNDPRSEGLVLKEVGVPLKQTNISKVQAKVVDNPCYVKIKYRDVSAADMARRR